MGDVNLIEQAAGNMWSPTIIYHPVARIWRGCVTNRTVHGVKKHSCRPPARLQLILELITCNSIALLVGITAVSCLAYWFVRQNAWNLCLLQISVDQLQLLRYYAFRFGKSPLNKTLKFTERMYKIFRNLREKFFFSRDYLFYNFIKFLRQEQKYLCTEHILNIKLSTNAL